MTSNDNNSAKIKTEWASAWLGLGGNVGNVLRNMRQALQMLMADGEVRLVACSSLYETPPWGFEDQPVFLNLCAEIATPLGGPELLKLCQKAEEQLKRKREIRWGPRNIDIDILMMNKGVYDLPDLKVPHPEITGRAFVLVPLAQIAPDEILQGKTIAQWRRECDDEGITEIAGSNDFDDLLGPSTPEG